MAPLPQEAPETQLVRATPAALGGEIRHPEDGHPRVWIIPAVVGAGIVATALLIWLVLALKRRQENKKADELDPYLRHPEFSTKRKMSAAERIEEEERQRIIMIRKSLASRSWGSESNTSRAASRISQTRSIMEDPEEEEPAQLKDDWKAWEARLQQETTLEKHPAAVESGKLAVPKPVRPRSPTRTPLLTQSADDTSFSSPKKSPRLSTSSFEQP